VIGIPGLDLARPQAFGLANYTVAAQWCARETLIITKSTTYLGKKQGDDFRTLGPYVPSSDVNSRCGNMLLNAAPSVPVRQIFVLSGTSSY
jgi:hypothetical protein